MRIIKSALLAVALAAMALGGQSAYGQGGPAWLESCPDQGLRALAGLALEKNRDSRLSALGALEARAAFGMAQSAARPGEAGGPAWWERAGGPGLSVGETNGEALTPPVLEQGYLNDLADGPRAALEAYLGAVESGREARESLSLRVAGAYLAARLAAERLALAEAHLTGLRGALETSEAMADAGLTDRMGAGSARGLVFGAEAILSDRKADLALAGIDLAYLVGDFGGLDLPDGLGLANWPGLPLPGGLSLGPPPGAGPEGGLALGDWPEPALPGELDPGALREGPAVRAAERGLMAAYANGGEAWAALFPEVSLTGKGEAGFNPGLNRARLDLADIRKAMAVATYEKTVQAAFREASRALALRDGLAGRLAAQENLVASKRTELEMARERFRAGVIDVRALAGALGGVLEAESALLGTKKDKILNDLAIMAAFGLGFQEAPAQSD
ncbi:MAG: TolC family protein [Deltaproteobacteria bacterium]|jgi:multidrug efflux system outer membrane protein|nr:TolC family protein [Deltaproteobacteria bacterium]